MGLNVSNYYDVSCNAKVNNLRAPDCLAISDGGFDPEEVEAAALAAGWTKSANGKTFGCAMHPIAAAAPTQAKRPPKSRDQILDPVVHDGPAGGV